MTPDHLIALSFVEDLSRVGLTDRLKAGPLTAAEAPVPYYHYVNGCFKRELLTLPAASQNLT